MPTEDPEAGATRYAQTVVDNLDPDDEHVVHVGHSLGGLTILVVASLRPVRRLVYVCALVPRPGASFDQLQHCRILQEVTPLPALPDVPATYIVCGADRALDSAWSRATAHRVLGVEPLELAGGHS